MSPRFRRRPLAAVFWCLAIAFLSQVLYILGTEGWQPRLADPEYGRKLACLRARRAERPDAPLLVALGSSRVALGLRPALLDESSRSSPQAPLILNLGIMRCHPVGELMYLRRLLEDGVHPDGLLVEVFLPMLNLGPTQVFNPAEVSRLRHSDVRLLRQYVSEPDALERRWLETQFTPWASHRLTLLNEALPGWLDRGYRFNQNWQGLDGWGWAALPQYARAPEGAERQRLIADVTGSWGPGMKTLQVSNMVDRAYRSLLVLCRDQRIAVSFLLMPEGSDFRSCYSAVALQDVDSKMKAWRDDYGAGIIDARRWCADSDFFEEVHLTHGGAAVFTKHLDREGLPVLIAQSRRSKVGPVVLAGRTSGR